MRGFTLIELLVVIVIVSIFAAIAVPSYQRYIQRANRAVVRATLADLAAKQDVQRLQTRSFATTFAALNGVASDTFYIDRTNKVSASLNSSTSIYKISFASGATADAFTLTAETVGSIQTKDTDCAKLTLSSAGVRMGKKSNNTDNPECWGR